MQLSLSDKPLHTGGRVLRLSKSYTMQEPRSHTTLTDDVFPFVEFYFARKRKALRYGNIELKKKYGKASQYDCQFYWKQAETFYRAAKLLPIESSPLAAYYCMLNAAKSYISFAAATVDSFVDQFGMHGLYEIIEDQGDGISGITICHKEKGVFPLFASLLDRDFSSVWSAGKSHSLSLQVLLYNLPFVHRAYQLTYSTRKTKVEEMFLPLQVGSSPEYIKGSDGKAYLRILLDPNHFPAYVTSIPNNIMDTISDRFALIGGRGFALRSVEGAKWNSNGSVSSDLRDMMNRQRKDYCYIRSSSRIWYLRRLTSTTQECLQLNTMTINMAIMHRLSEIVRYKPEQLQRLLQAEENWLLHEYMSLALDQFLDELAAEITHKDIMCTGVKE